MADDLDRYVAFYSEKLWQLLPAIYRAEDSDELEHNGPLREIVERIGAQAAIVRRSIDRLWEDQSIETCDDWIIDYIGELVATNLVASLDARGKRVDVAKTIYYRRRKGTVALLEELAGDITGWSVRVVEFFRRMERTRHGLDPAIGLAAPASSTAGKLQRAQGFTGPRTGTRPGGYADLRSAHGATLTGSPFDEFAHTADVRRGRGATGRHNISHLGVFVWRLNSFEVLRATAVHATGCKNQYTFDPTGRDIPLFAAEHSQEAKDWISPAEHEVPGPISAPLLAYAFANLYRDEKSAHSLSVYRLVGTGPLPSDYELVFSSEIEPDPRKATKPGATKLYVDPERGRIIAPLAATADEYRVDYHYGFAAQLGAGPYDRRVSAQPTDLVARNGVGLEQRIGDLVTAAGAAPVSGTIWIEDSLTYPAVQDVNNVGSLAIRAKNLCRPVLRSRATTWTFKGSDVSSTLLLDGLLISGGTEIVLQGNFAHVRISCCTLDPGSWALPTDPPTPSPWAIAADGCLLTPSWLRIEGTIRLLEIDRSIVGPISDTAAITAEQIKITDSIVQASDPNAPALSLTNSVLVLERCTILGGGKVHRLDASESILHDVIAVDDRQHGCVRFSAYASGSKLPRQYESVAIRPREDLFMSRDFGQPAYGQLVATKTAITQGAEDGSEMGAFCREKASIKERSLLVKYQEYLPLGIEPVIVHVT